MLNRSFTLFIWHKLRSKYDIKFATCPVVAVAVVVVVIVVLSNSNSSSSNYSSSSRSSRSRKSYFHSEQSLILSNICVIIGTLPIGDSIKFNNNIFWLAHIIYNYANVLFVFLYFYSKQSPIPSSVCVTIVTWRPIGDSHQDLMRFKNNKRTLLTQFILVCHSVEWLYLYSSANGCISKSFQIKVNICSQLYKI